MLKDRWKRQHRRAQRARTRSFLAEGQVRTFKIVKLDAEEKMIEVELA